MKIAPKTQGRIWCGAWRGRKTSIATPAPVKGMLIAAGMHPAPYLAKRAFGSPRSDRSERSRAICRRAPREAGGAGVRALM